MTAQTELFTRDLFGPKSLRAGSVDEEARTCEFIASTETIDAHGTVVKQDWRLDRFSANPVVLFNHDARCPIGTAEVNVATGDAGPTLLARVKFATGDEMAERCWSLVKQGVLRGMSVGFRPGRAAYEDRDGREVVVLENPELYEVSICSQPSNPDALAREQVEILKRSLMANPDKKGEQVTEPAADKRDASPAPAPAPAVQTATADSVSRTEHDAVVRALQSSIEQKQAAVAAADERAAKAEERAAAAEQRIKQLDGERLARKVDDLVGKKITPAQRETFLSLAQENERSFDAIVSTLPDIGAAPGVQVIPDKAGEVRTTDAVEDANTKRLEQLMHERIKQTGESRFVAMRQVMLAHPELCPA